MATQVSDNVSCGLTTRVQRRIAEDLETFTFGPADRLISRTCDAGTVQGWFGQYDGRRLGDPCPPPANVIGCALFDAWYQIQANYGSAMRAGQCPPLLP
jgi:hypothetical protein